VAVYRRGGLLIAVVVPATSIAGWAPMTSHWLAFLWLCHVSDGTCGGGLELSVLNPVDE
jgi:hypothetical protein